jgi:uncharacterized protein YjbI with pentapeptide repeats
MVNADLGEATLLGANLSGADLPTAIGLTQQQLDSAIGNANTKIPKISTDRSTG